MPHAQTRMLAGDVFEPPDSPRVDSSTARRRDLRCRSGPTFNQLALQFLRFGSKRPVAALPLDVIAEANEDLRGNRRRVRPERRAESLVGALMPVDEIANFRIVWRIRLEVDATVIAERKQERRTRLSGSIDQQAQPASGNQIEQRRRGDQRDP